METNWKSRISADLASVMEKHVLKVPGDDFRDIRLFG